MSKSALHVVTVEDVEHDLVREQEARRARIEAVTVDRSRYEHAARRDWCPEAASAEQWLSEIREQATLADRIHAYRVLYLGCEPFGE